MFLAWIVIPPCLLLTFEAIIILLGVSFGLQSHGTAGLGYPVWLAMMMLVGELVYCWGKNAASGDSHQE